MMIFNYQRTYFKIEVKNQIMTIKIVLNCEFLILLDPIDGRD